MSGESSNCYSFFRLNKHMLEIEITVKWMNLDDSKQMGIYFDKGGLLWFQ